ncbi:hypothetical protein [Nocardioides sp. TF02-7]|uniref:hypothetical protein n=1 Tax=Nocardioides sp. TF02-7 TaxID=2917724 RepID=UPI001F05A57B|nr:hypothetical protein [Nocardioides sp. TF02-7]UMG92231.1 hypothetical protein MF408_20330 [Nocardioides sp. TF02-7]
MAKRTRERGRCALCRVFGPLTFEHFPPKAVGNRLPVVMREWSDFVRSPSAFGTRMAGPVQQRGSGWYALCAHCNNWQGRELVPEYQKWALPVRMAMECEGGLEATAMADAVTDESVLHMTLTGDFKPGRFARYGLAATLLSTVKGDQAPVWHPVAAALVRQFDAQKVPDDFPRLFLSICAGPLVGVMGIQVAVRIGPSQSTTWHSSAYGRPFGFWLVEGPVKPGLLEITDWLEMSADQSASGLELGALTYGFSHLPFPGDLRSMAAIREQAGEPIDPHPNYRGSHPDRQGVGTCVTLQDGQRGTSAEVRIEVPGIWEEYEADDGQMQMSGD